MFTPKPPKIRTVSVQVKKNPQPNDAQKKASLQARPDKTVNGRSSAPTNRYNLTPSIKTTQKPLRPTVSQRASSLSVPSTQRKRKAPTPSTPQWASSDSESESENEVRKRHKASSSIEPLADFRRCLEPDLKRRIQYEDPESRQEPTGEKEKRRRVRLIQGLDMSSGEQAKDFKPAFRRSEENIEEKFVVELQYPSSQLPEKFETVVPHDPTNFDPLKDIEYSIEEIIQNYLPPSVSVDLLDETTGTVRLLKRAVAKNHPADYRATLTDFNNFIRTNVENGTISSVLTQMSAIPLSLTKRILAQVYQRTVSPHVHLLRRVKEKATTYGELLPPFVHSIFHQTGLSSSCVFVDLGSGVGNVVLQSALQTGAESWGIEIMDTPAKFAVKQASELRARARMWNINLGPMHLLHGDFLDAPKIDEILRRADVVLVNNKVFPQQLNGALLDKFLDLKEGAKVVSLEPFAPGGKSQGIRNEQNVFNLFEEEKFESGTQSVSWAGESVDYYIATKVR
ncbi:DOT1-domain-containing protein [Delitschia confertaspora ATCC 74209]|uniref:Histone-lysine N-methyltransferase, H3 lysine-79 specific n=1 Tax=Delitschia confertaspora ATCC 74209 TaxID=1513339 RepID=A0A9P4JGD0_9PLEO|nr:DOT1-domain-containing protein [Delitschia confertaspora ATCC 74209]